MGEQFPAISDDHLAYIDRQHVFFAATATGDSRINMSPREASAFRVIGPNCVAYMDRTGSGNEAAAHLKVDGRMTIMFCAFEGAPGILRLYGAARILHRDSQEYAAALAEHFDGAAPPGARQIVWMDVDLVQSSCGFGVPLFDYKEERKVLERWAIGKGPEKIEDYWRQKNMASIDGLPTGIFEAAE